MPKKTCPQCGFVGTTLGGFACHVRFGKCGVTEEQLFWAKVDKTSSPGGCWLWLGFLNHDGYGRVGPKRGVRSGGRAHKVIWEMIHGKVPAGMSVMHTCDVRACVNPAHLKAGTHRENMDDCYAKRRHIFGERNSHAKLTEEQVLEIRQFAGKATQREVAARYGVSQTAIAAIFNRRSWKFL
jgi:hypothetical protein